MASFGKRMDIPGGKRRIRRNPIFLYCQVEGEQVPIRQAVVVGHAVQHCVVDCGADVVPERPTPERRRIVDITRCRSRRVDHLPRPLVDVEQVRPHPAPGLEALEDVADNPACDSRPVQLARGEDLDHPAPSHQ